MTQVHNVADGKAGASNPHPHPTTPTHSYAHGASKTLVFPLFNSFPRINGRTKPLNGVACPQFQKKIFKDTTLLVVTKGDI